MNKEKISNHLTEYEINGQEIKLTGNIVKEYLTRGNSQVSDQEVVMFINLCKYQKLNPFLNEAYLVKFKGAPAQIITSKEAYMKRAFEHPQFDGLKAGIIVKRGEEILELEGSFCLKTDTLVGGWAEVHVKDKQYPYVTKINLDEFSKGQATWNKMPKTMIRKTALVQALREAFPDNMGAIAVDDEPETKETTVEVEVADEIKQNANSEVIDFEEAEIVEEYPAQEVKKEYQHQNAEKENLYEGPGF